ncbi:type II toxin-antitoxin system death-on-curing family toxin [Mucilaginibacter ginkgonis]|uniref:Type II toxin-antitoxin system death-on-curing family toxin n=1 Tax=Mucilaginibacter ginkgonis TaxID=2682091 RepID=A0A7T7FCP6_9SPHI|nr:type II toxin-antitoxin system death-on-curing family toxin [Mucilaginibacter ginkgonis]QQL50698.1 type II toxin-antitoxin system death-on-curing family toxin [Mucilaginibacter ginkgonis]
MDVERIHNVLIDAYGGSKGIRDIAGLEAAINRPFATFDQQDLYPSAFEKAAAIFESLIINHPFIDGNKRIAYAMARVILLKDNLTLEATEDEKYNFVIAASTGELRYEDILALLKSNVASIK